MRALGFGLLILSLGARAGERAVCAGCSPAWFPDGRRLAFSRTVGTDRHIGVVELESGKVTWLSTRPGIAFDPAVSRAGRVVWAFKDTSETAFAAARHDSERASLYLWETGAVRRLSSGTDFNYTPSFSPDGYAVYYASTAVADGTHGAFKTTPYREWVGLRRLDLMTGAVPMNLWVPPEPMQGAVSPRLSPDGRTLAWAQMDGFFSAWKVMHAPVASCAVAPSGAPADAVCASPVHMPAYAPDWHPSGKALVFTGFRPGSSEKGWSLFVVRLADGRLTRVAEGTDGVWDPTGRRLAYVREGTLYVKDVDWMANESLPESQHAGATPPTCPEAQGQPPEPEKRHSTDRPSRFEKIALLDTFDFQYFFDIETPTGNEQVLEHVLGTGATTVLVRHQSGGIPRYPSAEEDLIALAHPLDKRRLPETRPIASRFRPGVRGPDLVADTLVRCAGKGVRGGVHFTLEEAHNSSWSTAGWNFEHPEYWCRDRAGEPWAGHCSFAYPEVVEHRLRQIDEMVARGAETIYLDTSRFGSWRPKYEYVEPVLDAFRTRYGNAAIPENPMSDRWLQTVWPFQRAFYRAVRKRLDAAPRKIRLLLGVEHIGHPGPGWRFRHAWFATAVDWKRLADEGTIDGLVVCNLRPDPTHLWEDTEKICRDIVAYAGVPVFLPVLQYSFGEKRPSYHQFAKWSGMSDADVVRRLLEIYAAAGAAGIVMECVDYRNYAPDVCARIRAYSVNKQEK